jgi:hypothetical protein
MQEHGEAAVQEFYQYYPGLKSEFYNAQTINLEAVLHDADLVMVHEWNDHDLVKKIGALRKKSSFKLLFHDTHHRAVTERESMKAYDLSQYDGVLAFGNVITEIYKKKAGQNEPGPGTKPQTRVVLNPCLQPAMKATLFGSGTGAMTKGPKNFLNSS